MKMLRKAMESLEEEQGTFSEEVVEGEEGVHDVEADVMRAVEKVDSHFEEAQTDSVVLESLRVYEGMLVGLIANNTCTRETGSLIATGVQQQLNRLGVAMPSSQAMESYGDDPKRQHEVALEGIREAINTYFQAVVLNLKHQVDITIDLFRTTSSKIPKYHNRLAAAEAEYDGKKGSWRNNNHHGDLTSLWYHFATDAGQAKDVMDAIHKDLDMSKYVLVTYPKEMVNMVKKLASIVRGGKATTIDQVKKLAKNVEALGHPADDFRKTYLGGMPYLSVTGLEPRHGTVRSSVDLDGVTFKKLAEMASPRGITQTSSAMHTVKKIASHIHVGPILNMTLSAGIDMTTEDIQKLIDSGYSYIENVSDHLAMSQSLSNATTDYSKAMQTLISTIDNDLSSSDLNSVQQILKQIDQVVNNITHCFQSPATAEIARSLKGAKYCAYLTRRMIWNAE